MNKFLRTTPAMARLFVIRGNATADSVAIPLPCLIGRGRETNLFVDSLLVSRNHCRLDLFNGKVFITDLGSRNGTTVNGQLLSQHTPVELSNQSVFSIGPLTFQLEFQPTKVDHSDAPNINSVSNLQLAIGN